MAEPGSDTPAAPVRTASVGLGSLATRSPGSRRDAGRSEIEVQQVQERLRELAGPRRPFDLDRRHRHELHPTDLAGVRREGTVDRAGEQLDELQARLVDHACLPERRHGRADAELLLELARRALVVRLAALEVAGYG